MSTQRRVEQDQEQCAFEAPGTGGFFLWKKSSVSCAVEGVASISVVRLQSWGQIGTGTRSIQDDMTVVSLSSSWDQADGLTASSFHLLYGKTGFATNSLNSSSRCQWRICHGSGTFSQQLPLISPLLSSAFRWNQRTPGSCEPKVADFDLVMQSALSQVSLGGLPWDGKATWPRKFVSPARRTKRGLPFWKMTSSPRFITSGKMNTHSRDRFIKAA
jgi:hypothetical protein